MESVLKKSLLITTCFALVLLFTPVSASADTACFTWVSCPVNEVQFDASCSSGDPFIWKYRWDFGDGTGTRVGTPTVTHTYPGDGVQQFTVLLEIQTYTQFTTVSCTVDVMDAFYYGPQQCWTGTCS